MAHLIQKDKGERGFSGYFWSMLADNPRAFQYRDAINACASECREVENESVTVIDIGCGSGLLSILAAQNPDVSKVWGVDTNEDAIQLATNNAKRVLGPELVGKGKKLEFVLTLPDKCPPTIPKVHMIISEILGTLINSENAMKYVGMYMREKLIPSKHGHVYVIPRTCTQKMSLHSFHQVPSCLQVAVTNAVNLAWTHLAWCPTNENGLSVLLHAFPSTVSASAVVRIEKYDTSPPRVVAGAALPIGSGSELKDEDLHLVLFEWVVTLWKKVVLKNTVAELRNMSKKRPSSSLSRDSAWGFIAVPPIWNHVMTAKFSGTGLTVDAADTAASGPPQGDFRSKGDEEGSMLASVRYAADFDFADRLVRGFLETVQDANGRMDGITVVVYNDTTSGNVMSNADDFLTPLGANVLGLSYENVSYKNGEQAYPKLYGSKVKVAKRGWRTWLRELKRPIHILAPSRMYEDRKTAKGYPYNEFQTYPPILTAEKTKVSMVLPDGIFNGGLRALKEAGTYSLLREKRPCVPYNLFPSIAYTDAEFVAPQPNPPWLSEAFILLPSSNAVPSPPPSHLPVGYAYSAPVGGTVSVQLKECSADNSIPSSNWRSLRELAKRNTILCTDDGDIYLDQLNIVARVTSNATPFQFCSV